MERDKAQYADMKINKRQKWCTANTEQALVRGLPSARRTSGNEGFTLRIFSSFNMRDTLHDILHAVFFTYPPVPASIDGLFKALKPC